MKPKHKQNTTRNRVALATGIVGGALMIYGAYRGGFGLNPPEKELIPWIAPTIGLYLFIATPAIVWRKDLLVAGLGLLTAVVLWARITAGSY